MRIIDEKAFTDLFIICLAARADLAEKTSEMWTTVEAFTKILIHMSILDDTAHERIVYNTKLQSHFARRLDLANQSDQLPDQLANCKSPLLTRFDPAADFNRERMLRNMRIYITDKGFGLAAKIEDQYADILTGERFLEARREREEEFDQLSDVARASMLKRWQSRQPSEETPGR